MTTYQTYQQTAVLLRSSPSGPHLPDGGAGLMASLLPPRVAASEAFGHGDEEWWGALLPAEARLMAGAGAKRRRDFAGVRVCARRALRVLGFGPVPVLPGPRGEPRWPAGVVGSMTHCAGYRAAVVARPETGLAGLGIDAEPHAPLSPDVLEMVASPAERAHVAMLADGWPRVHWGRVLFCVKEAVFKAWYPLAHTELGFLEAEVAFQVNGDGSSGGVTAEVRRPGPFTVVSGHWRVADGVIATAVVAEAAAAWKSAQPPAA
ncbi:4'-phosphopantetheinyl transferase [Streptomyces sp. CoH27]|uniref:4'-phosphopantetheinyl transferase family protein n=1 Tax=Streptomyces sp. CoH27 TaxID=2875763 RepID=UPI001CD57381|nr:4'-phosphopantetheinyl transferase superfamily protein [Streptomyces sp. CoH27]